MTSPINPLPGDFFYGDADIETAGLVALAGQMDALRAKGHCVHGGCERNPDPKGRRIICNDLPGVCTETWDTDREWFRAHQIAREGGQA